MNPANLFKDTRLVGGLCLNIVRTHVKMVPWRTRRDRRECYLDPNEKPYTDKHNMAEFMRNGKSKQKPWMKVIPKEKDSRYNDYVWHDSYVSDPKEAKLVAEEKLKRMENSLRSRGEARETQPYDPPENVELQIKQICLAKDPSQSVETVTSINLNANREIKRDILIKCIESFKHDIPSSYLNEFNTFNDLVNYYSTPVRGLNPYSAMVRTSNELPMNLTLIAEPFRYDSENDEFFGGHNALPGLISKIPGLRAQKKFPVLNQKEFQWPDI